MNAWRVAIYAVAGLAVGAVAYRVIAAGRSVAQAAGDVGRTVTGTVAKVANAVNPTNPQNVFAGAADKVTQTVTGDPSTSLGSALYDLLNPGDQAGKIATAPSVPRAPAVVLPDQYDREDSELGFLLRSNAEADLAAARDLEDAQLGQAMRYATTYTTPGGAFLDYGHLFGRR